MTEIWPSVGQSSLTSGTWLLIDLGKTAGRLASQHLALAMDATVWIAAATARATPGDGSRGDGGPSVLLFSTGSSPREQRGR